jgi:hypothetical protein
VNEKFELFSKGRWMKKVAGNKMNGSRARQTVALIFTKERVG